MSLTAALNIGKNALAVQQAAIQTTGNNIANAGNEDYTRQVAGLSAVPGQQLRPGVFLGGGVNLDDISRQIDSALQSRLQSSVSDDQSAQTVQQWLSRVESTFNELGDDDLSSRLSAFFGGWSNLANKPQDIGLRQVVVQNGQSVAKWLNDLHGQLSSLQSDIDARLPAAAQDADALAQQVADLNEQIAVAEGGTGGIANDLRDQRDGVIKKLSELMDVKTIEQGSILNVYVGSEPLVIGTNNRGVAIRSEPTANGTETTVTFKSNNGAVNVTGGQIGGLVKARKDVTGVIDNLNKTASGLIFELNKIHGSGQGLEGFSSVTSQNIVEDSTVALNDPKTGLANTATNGSFVVHVKDKTTGLVTSTLVQVDLDGLNANDTTLNSLKTSLAGIAGVNATTSGGRLTVAAGSPNVEVSFSQDSSGVLASLGVNNFFSGKNAYDIAVNQNLIDRPQLLAAAKNGQSADNQTARAIADLENQTLGTLNGQSLKDSYQGIVNGVANAVGTAKTDAEAAKAVYDTLRAQRENLSGVSLDEEAVNLMKQQRAFQGAAKLVSTVNELMDVVIGLVR